MLDENELMEHVRKIQQNRNLKKAERKLTKTS